MCVMPSSYVCLLPCQSRKLESACRKHLQKRMGEQNEHMDYTMKCEALRVAKTCEEPS